MIRKKKKDPEISVSVIVPNHGRDITKLIDSIPKSKSIELIVIDEGKERSEQRNIGIKRAKGQYLLILDSDQYIHPQLIENCLMLASAGYETLYIPEIITTGGWFGEIRAFERGFFTGTPVDVPRFVKRKGCPLFNPELTGPEDADWGNRLPKKRATTTLPLYHDDDIDFWGYVKKKVYYNLSMKRYRELWPNDPCIKLSYRVFKVYIENGKWKLLLKYPFHTFGIIFLLAVRGIIYYGSR